jgi:MYXO-CTERM domain-containing protein
VYVTQTSNNGPLSSATELGALTTAAALPSERGEQHTVVDTNFIGVHPMHVSRRQHDASDDTLQTLEARMNNHRPARSGWRFSGVALAGLLALTASARTAHAAAIKVSCIGEQTTHSDLYPTTTNQPVGMQEYPAMLQTLLGAGYTVMNYGDCCASVVSGYTPSETHPFINGNKFGPSISFAPDIVIIGSWGRHDWGKSAQNALAAFTAGDTMTTYTKFQTDYDTLVSKYMAAASKPKIFCSTPIPIPFGMDGPDDGYKTSPAAAAVKAVCQKYNLPIIDLYTAFTGHMEYYINPPDKDSEGEHTSVAGMMETAKLVYEAITGADGGVLASTGGGDDAGSASGSSSSGTGDVDATLPGSGGTGTDTASGTSSGSSSGGSSAASASPSSSGDTSGTSGSSFVSGGGTGTGSASGDSATGGTGTSSSSSSETGTTGNSDTTTGDGSSGKGCSTAPGVTGRSPWNVAAFAVFGLALVSRRRNRRRTHRTLGRFAKGSQSHEKR